MDRRPTDAAVRVSESSVVSESWMCVCVPVLLQYAGASERQSDTNEYRIGRRHGYSPALALGCLSSTSSQIAMRGGGGWMLLVGVPSCLSFAFPPTPARLVSNAIVTVDLLQPGDHLPPTPPDATYWLSCASESLQLDAVCQAEMPAALSSTAALLRLVVCMPSKSSPPAQAAPDDAVPVGTRLLLSDEAVNVWEFRLDRGEECVHHRHLLPYVFINLATSTTQALGPDGEEVGEANVQHAGHCVFVPAEALGEHGVRNVGEECFVQFVVELKRCANDGTGTPPGSIPEAEERVATLFARLKTATAKTAEADALVVELQMAREALAAMQVDEQRRTCDIGAARGPIALA